VLEWYDIYRAYNIWFKRKRSFEIKNQKVPPDKGVCGKIFTGRGEQRKRRLKNSKTDRKIALLSLFRGEGGNGIKDRKIALLSLYLLYNKTTDWYAYFQGSILAAISSVKFTSFYNDPPIQSNNMLTFEEQDPTSSGEFINWGKFEENLIA